MPFVQIGGINLIICYRRAPMDKKVINESKYGYFYKNKEMIKLRCVEP